MKATAENILIRLMTNKSITLRDEVYTVRQNEGKGWEGPDVLAWQDAVEDAERWMEIHGSKK